MQTGGVDQAVLDAGGLTLSSNGVVATITLDRPETRNAQTPATWQALRIIGASLDPGRAGGRGPRRRGHVLLGAGPPDARPGGSRRGAVGHAPAGPAGPRDGREHRDLAGGVHLAAPPRHHQRRRRPGGRGGRRLPAGAGLRPAGARPTTHGSRCASRCSGSSRTSREQNRWSTLLATREPWRSAPPPGGSRPTRPATSGWPRWSSPATELDDAVADLVAALTAPIYGAVTETKSLLQSAGRPRPRGPAPRRARGAGPPVPGAGVAPGGLTERATNGR